VIQPLLEPHRRQSSKGTALAVRRLDRSQRRRGFGVGGGVVVMSGILESTADSIAPSRTLVQWRNTALRFDYHRFGDKHRPAPSSCGSATERILPNNSNRPDSESTRSAARPHWTNTKFVRRLNCSSQRRRGFCAGGRGVLVVTSAILEPRRRFYRSDGSIGATTRSR